MSPGSHRQRHATGAIWAAALFLASPAETTHAVDHRYVVLGQVRDGADRPVTGRDVRVVREKTGLSSRTKTDAEGFYLLVVHLHDEDLGDMLEVTAGSVALRVPARFDPRDRTTHRGTRVDFRGSQAAERPAIFLETLAAYLKP